MKTPLLIEQHIHGAFGVDFNTATSEEIVVFTKKLCKMGFYGFFPTLVTDSLDNIKRQIERIYNASLQTQGILGIHLEGVFINPEKKGIHNSEHFLELTIENYKKIEHEFIKIVTLAPELDKGLIGYLHKNNVKVQAGHCCGWGNVDGVTHTFNAMKGVSHRENSTTLSTLLDDDVYAEIIADGIHVGDDALKLFFKSKPDDKVILVSDSLPITYSKFSKAIFADSDIFYDGEKATSKDGTIAGSTKLLPEIIKILGNKGLFKAQYIKNVYDYHSIPVQGEIVWDEEFNIIEIKK